MKGKGRSTYPAINVLLAVYTLTCGMHVDQVSRFTVKIDQENISSEIAKHIQCVR